MLSRSLMMLFISIVVFFTSCHTVTKEQPDAKDILHAPPYATLTDSITKFPNDALLYLERARILSQHNLHETATSDYKKLWELNPDETTAMQYASNLSITNRQDEAMQLMLSAIRQFPEGRELKRMLGDVYLQLNKNSSALQLYDTLLKSDSADFEAWYEKGMLLAKMKDTTGAIEALRSACTIQPISTYILELAHLYAETNNAEALRLCDLLIRKDSARDLVDPFFIKGIYFANTGKYETAVIQFDSCVRRDWKFTEAYIEKGIIFFKQKNYDVAMNTFRMAATVSNSDPDAYFWMGRCYEAINKKDDAVEYYEKALALDRNFAEAAAGIQRLKP